MLAGVVALGTKALDAFLAVFNWKTGGRTRDENTLRAEGEEAHDNLADALMDRNVAAANAARSEQRRVLDEARAKRP